MPLPIIIAVSAVAILTLGGIGALVGYWNRLADYMLRTVLPWLHENLPMIEPLAKEIFRLGDPVAAGTIVAIRQKWRELKEWLLGQLEKYERLSNSVYLKKVCIYFRKRLETGEVKTFETVVTREVDVSEIPLEFRMQVLGKDQAQVNLTEHIEDAIEQMILQAEG